MAIDGLQNINDLRLAHQLQTQSVKSLINTKSDTVNIQSESLSFTDILNKELENSNTLQFSKHAINRMNERGIDVNQNLQNDLNAAVEKARSKGAKDVVIISPNSAFIVNVKNNMVVTTMNSAEMKENIFTNIDSAIIL